MTSYPSDRVLTKQAINEMMETEAGRDEFMFHMLYTRIAYGFAQIHSTLYPNTKMPPKETQHQCVMTMMEVIWKKPVEEIIEEYLEANEIARTGMAPINAATLQKMVTRGDA